MATIALTETENESRAVVVLNRTVREDWVWEPTVAVADDGLRKELKEAFEDFVAKIEAFKVLMEKKNGI